MHTLSELSQKFFEGCDLTALRGETAASDSLSFKNALCEFLKSGRKEDAFTVYFCYSEIFDLFGKGYANTDKLLELLSDHEYHSGELLSKHRDHYSHSVYVFALGLAIYRSDRAFARAYNAFYGLEGVTSPTEFLRSWGMVALFHDVGYPFQLAHEQIKNYSEELWGKGNCVSPYVSFGDMGKFTRLTKKTGEKLAAALGAPAPFKSIDELLCYGLETRFGYETGAMKKLLRERIVRQPNYMDHGYFGAVVLARQLLRSGREIGVRELDALTAILLHNSLQKYGIKGAKPVKRDAHPLCYLLMLCDELQNWDRLAYGKVSKRDPLAWDIALDIGDDRLDIEFYFDSKDIPDANGVLRPNKHYTDAQSGKFAANFYTFLDTPLKITSSCEERKKVKKHALYASDDNFINLCDFAKAIHSSYVDNFENRTGADLAKIFGDLDLEFKIANIAHAKSFAYKLELVNCFYSRKDLDYPVVENFESDSYGIPGSNNFEFLCREEHVRWVNEKLENGWVYRRDYDPKDRNKLKVHKDIVPYEMLTPAERSKDELMIRNIIPFLRKFGNNVRVYSYRTGRKPDLHVCCAGELDPAKSDIYADKIKNYLANLSDSYRVIARSRYLNNADLLFAQCAFETQISAKAVLPYTFEGHIKKFGENAGWFTEKDERDLRHALARTVVCKILCHRPDCENALSQARDYMVKNCKKMIVFGGGDSDECVALALENGYTENDIVYL